MFFYPKVRHNYYHKTFKHSRNQIMNELPNEILIKIFKHLEYWDLKLTIPLVSKRFNSIVKQKRKFGTIDRILFRDAVPRPGLDRRSSSKQKIPTVGTTLTNFKLHPVFDLLSYTWSETNTSDAIVFKHNDKIKLRDSSVATENAITPASYKVLLHFDLNGHKINVDGSSSSREAIPVIGVMATIVMMLMHEITPENSARMPIGAIVGGFKWNGFEKVEEKDGYVHLYLKHVSPPVEENAEPQD